jgi:exodeoxyribonuclease-3
LHWGLEARAISAVVDGVRLWSVYVPNGRSLDDPHYDYKLRWLSALGDAVAEYSASPDALPYAVGGDFNIAPLEGDVGDPDFQRPGTTHTSPAERSALEEFLDVAGLADAVRPHHPHGYTFWDYTQGKFAKDQGLRIDFIFGSVSFRERVVGARIDASERTGESPSDHVPVVVELDADEDDDRPMVF